MSYWYVLRAYARALMITCTNSMCQDFHRAKKFMGKIFANGIRWQNWCKFSPGENFHVYGILFQWAIESDSEIANYAQGCLPGESMVLSPMR